MSRQLSLLAPEEGRDKLWFRAVDALGRPVADIPVHECVGGWGEAASWCYLAVYPINAAIRFARRIEDDALRRAGEPLPAERRPSPCCLDAPFDRHFLAHVAANCS